MVVWKEKRLSRLAVDRERERTDGGTWNGNPQPVELDTNMILNSVLGEKIDIEACQCDG